jgi:hypothetical protein
MSSTLETVEICFGSQTMADRWTSSIIKHVEPLTLEEKEQLVEDFAGVSSNK